MRDSPASIALPADPAIGKGFRRYDSAVTIAALFLVTAAVNLEMPLYRTYAALAGYGNGPVTLVFAAYVAGLLPTLLFLGGISDRLGRKLVLLTGLSAALAATCLMLNRPGMGPLFAARVLQGIGVGLSVGAGSAYLAETFAGARAAQRAAGWVALATSLGFGGGALFTGTWLLFGPVVKPGSYAVHAVATAFCLALTLALRSRKPSGGGLVRWPYFPTGSVPIALTIALAWAVTGIVISLVPGQLAKHGLSAWAGHALFLLNGTGVLVQPWARRLESRQALYIGAWLLPVGYGALLLGAGTGSLPFVLLGAAVTGSACYGFTYLGGLAELSLRGGEKRARAVSGYFALAYLGFGLPSVGLGFLSDRFGLMPALSGFGILLILLCAWQALWAAKGPRERAPR